MSDNPEHRDLITRYKIDQANGRTVARLWRQRDQHPEFLLFNVAELADAGLDWQSAEPGQEHPCRFWCVWKYSAKTKSTGNPYKDILRLEPHQAAGAPNHTVHETLRAIQGELQAIKALILNALETAQLAPTDAPSADALDPEALDDALFDPHQSRFDQIVAGLQASAAPIAAELDRIVARIRASLNGHGWDLALQCLEHELSRWETLTPQQRNHRQKVVDRLTALLDSPEVQSGQIQHTLKPGWAWTYAYDDIVTAGKALKTQIEQLRQAKADIGPPPF